MSSYWSKRRRIVSTVNSHLRALNDLIEDSNQHEDFIDSNQDLAIPQLSLDSSEFSVAEEDTADSCIDHTTHTDMFEAYSPVSSEDEASDSSDYDSDNSEAVNLAMVHTFSFLGREI